MISSCCIADLSQITNEAKYHENGILSYKCTNAFFVIKTSPKILKNV